MKWRKIMNLSQIQTKLKAPKDLYNNFGKYSYRNCEGILEALKPILQECEGTIILTDKIIEVGGRVYVEAKATLSIGENTWSSSASAREALDKKGMDEAQITGSASSYARKYALNGLFALDDTKDPDETNKHGKDEDPQHKGANPGKTKLNKKPLYETFGEDVERIRKAIMSKKSSADAVIEHLEKTHTVNDKIKQEIKSYES